MALSTQRASSSTPRWKHDVFLSFRGEDTRKGIVAYIYHELMQNRGIETFMDDRGLQIGTSISPSLLTAIEESRSAVVVLSPNYASSTWCLDELTKILQCMEDKNTLVFPVFYDVDPSHVRSQRGSFAEAFTKHEEKFRQGQDVDKVKRWRASLTKVANLSGLASTKYGSDRELVKDVVEIVCNKVGPLEIESTRDFVKFEATRHAMDEVMNALRDEEVTAIGIYGMGGVGKTTMVKHVGEVAKKHGLFHHVIMVVVSQSPEVRKIQGAFADVLGLELRKETDNGRAAIIMKKIMSENRMLIILDDIWMPVDLSSIGIPSHNELQRCNSKILLTTRRLSVCRAMETQKSISLNVLSDDDSWKLFEKKARKSFGKSSTLYDVARKVAKECAGLPVALIAVARALGDKDLHEWEKAAQQLKVDQPANPEDENDVFKCIKLSYDYLRSDVSKSCFLLCCLFPDDYDIEIEDLLMYGIGKGMFQDSKMEEARVATYSVIDSLKASSLLLDSERGGCVKMHDVIRDVAISISLSQDGQRFLVQAGCALREWPTIHAHEGYSAISLMKNKLCKLPRELVCSKLQILSLRSNADIGEIPRTFFPSKNTLSVLDLSETSISCLPQSFSVLTNLQTLYLDYCKSLFDISLVGKLKKLEILSMKEFPCKELPKEIRDLTNLRMLDITNGIVDTIPSKVIMRLYRLEELYMQCNFRDWGSGPEGARGYLSSFFGVGINACFGELTGLPCLNTLKVWIFDVEYLPKNVEFIPNWVNFNIRISRHPFPKSSLEPDFSRILTLNTVMATLPNWFVNVVVEKVEKLEYIDYCKGLSNIFVEYKHGRLHGLKSLSLIGPHDDLEVLINAKQWVQRKEAVFQKLRELHLIRLDRLKQLCIGELPLGSLSNLQILEVSGCMELRNLFTFDVAQCLFQLEDLSIEDCPRLDRVIEPSEEIGKDEIIVFPRLKFLVLKNLPCLTSFYNSSGNTTIDIECLPLKHLRVWNCPHFSTLQVESCRKLANALLPSTLMQSLQNLEKVICVELLHIEYVFGCEGLEPEQIVVTKLRELKLRSFWALRNIWNGPVPHAIFQNLQILEVSGCMELTSLFTFDVAQWLLQLKDLTIEDCPILDRVIEPSKEIGKNEIIVFPRLKFLVLKNLPRLTSFYNSSGNTTIDIECLPLKHLRVWNCPHFSTLQVESCRKLANAFLPSTLMQSLQNLEKVICVELLHIEYVFGCEGLEPEQIVLTKLRELKLRSFWALRNIWNGPVPHAIFQNLQILEVSGCMELTSLFTFDVAQWLLQLKYLTIEDCPRLGRVIEPSKEIGINKIIVFPRLKSLVLRNLTRLISFYSSSGNTSIDIECPPLKYLRVWNCPHFSTSAFDFLRNTKTLL